MSTTFTPAVVTAAQDAVSRAVRQALQALVPTLLILAGGSATGIDVPAVLVVAGLAALISVLKSLANVRLAPSAPVWKQLVERGVVAGAGAALGLVTVDGTTAAASIPWEATLTASLGAGALAVVMFFTNPPARLVQQAADGSYPIASMSAGDDRVPGPRRAEDLDDPFPPRA